MITLYGKFLHLYTYYTFHVYLTFYDSCGKKAFEEGYRYFCIEFYGECWGYKEFNVTQPQKYGPKTCWGKHPNYQLCNQDQKNPVCVGTQDHGYLYEVN